MSVKGKYRLLQCLYWMSGCVAWGYFVSYLTEYGYSALLGGFLAAGFSLTAAVLQPVLGRIADKSARFHWKRIFVLLAAATELVLLVLLFARQSLIVGIFFGLYSMLVTTLNSMVNVVCFYYEHRGTDMNFGVARGLGSFAYAALSFVLGRLIAPLGIRVVVVAGLVIMTVMLVLALSFPYYGNGEAETAEATRPAAGRAGFLRKYPAFLLMVAAVALYLFFHDMYTNYLLYILSDVGGDNASLGTALSIAALVEIPVMFLSGRLIKRFTSRLLLVFAGVMLVVRGILYCLAGSVGAIYLIQLLQVPTFAVIASAMVIFTDECMEERDLATGQSLMGMTMAIGNTFGYLIGGILIDRFGTKVMLLCGTVASLLGTVLAVLSVQRQKHEGENNGG